MIPSKVNVAPKPACPFCHLSLEEDRRKGFYCAQCHRYYPMQDNIPCFWPEKIPADNPMKEVQREYNERIRREYLNQDSEDLAGLCHRHAIRRIKDLHIALTEDNLPNSTVLEIGCGMGQLTEELNAKVRSLVALDLAVESLHHISQKISGNRCQLWQGNGLRLPLHDKSVDGIYASEVIEHVPDAQGMIHELARVCRSGGWVSLSTPNPWITLFYPQGLIHVLRHPLRWRAIYERNINSTGLPHGYDRWIFPHRLRAWLEESGFIVHRHFTTILYDFDNPLFSLLSRASSKRKWLRDLYQKFLAATDVWVEWPWPFLCGLGIRQFVFAQKRGKKE